MDILLTHGYFLAEDEREQQIMRPYPPLGLLYISAYLKREGFEVEVADSTFLRQHELIERIRRERPPVVGIYANLMTRKRALAVAAASKEAGSIVVFGGPEPVNYAEAYLDHGGDVVVVGEGEVTLSELLPALRGNGPHVLASVPGIIYRDESGAIVRNPAREQIEDLDELPDPDRDAIDLDRYLAVWGDHHGLRSVSLITCRGCPYTCTWCSHGVYGNSHRRRSVDRVVAEIEQLRERYQPDQLWFADDVFTIHAKWTREFAEKLAARKIRIPFECISRADRMNEEMCDVVAQMGCRKLWIGSESGSQKILDAMKRGVSAERVRDVTAMLRSRGVEVGMFLMWGYEGEELEDIEATIEHVRRARPDEFLTTVSYPIKGTPYYDLVADKSTNARDWSESSDREIEVNGRYTRRFYSLADRRMRSLVAFDRARERSDVEGRLRALVHRGRAGIWKVGMRLERAGG